MHSEDGTGAHTAAACLLSLADPEWPSQPKPTGAVLKGTCVRASLLPATLMHKLGVSGLPLGRVPPTLETKIMAKVASSTKGKNEKLDSHFLQTVQVRGTRFLMESSNYLKLVAM